MTGILKEGSVREVIETVGSVCSGIEAASAAWAPLGFSFQWFSEIAPFPSRVLAEKFPSIPNLGDMTDIPDLLEKEEISAPDLICGGTPCQAFSISGRKEGLKDMRGNLTLRFADIVGVNDAVRKRQGKEPCMVFWENVPGVLHDKTNAFGRFLSTLAGLDQVLEMKRWPDAGVLRGKVRVIAWRVLDAKYFGLAQQRKRLYVVAGGRESHPEAVLFELHTAKIADYPSVDLTFQKEGHTFEIFRGYADCLCSSYGHRWDGNAASRNGSLFTVQDGRLRRLSPLECERLMGFPDGYTDLPGASKTSRYEALGNSWAVPVIRRIGERLTDSAEKVIRFCDHTNDLSACAHRISEDEWFYDLSGGIIPLSDGLLNCTDIPETSSFHTLPEILSPDAPEELYISPVGCAGIVRRAAERGYSLNSRLKEVLIRIAEQMPPEEIEKISHIQKRGAYAGR